MENMLLRDDGEAINLFEPLMISQGAAQRPLLNDLAVDLAEKSAMLKSSLPPSIAESLSALIRSMNCYYSNLIEGHNTHPVDIERALAGDYSSDPEKRDLQFEAKAHIAVQAWIDEGGLTDAPTAPKMILEMHRRFCENLPEDLLRVSSQDGSESMLLEVGKFRVRDVAVGKHIAISPGSISRFLERMHNVYPSNGRIEPILGPGLNLTSI